MSSNLICIRSAILCIPWGTSRTKSPDSSNCPATSASRWSASSAPYWKVSVRDNSMQTRQLLREGSHKQDKLRKCNKGMLSSIAMILLCSALRKMQLSAHSIGVGAMILHILCTALFVQVTGEKVQCRTIRFKWADLPESEVSSKWSKEIQCNIKANLVSSKWVLVTNAMIRLKVAVLDNSVQTSWLSRGKWHKAVSYTHLTLPTKA